MSSMTTGRNAEPWRRRLYLPAYQVGDAARYAGTSAQSVAYWHYRGGSLGPALPGKTRRQPLTYLQLIEVAFVSTFRDLGVPLQRIRRARAYAAQNLNAEFPFAEYRWLTEGLHLMLDLRDIDGDADIGRLVVGDADGQLAWQELVSERFAQFEYESGLATIWYVQGRRSPVKIDPRVSFGAPTIRGIPTWTIRGRWRAGENLRDIHEDFHIEESDIRAALRFEGIDAGQEDAA